MEQLWGGVMLSIRIVASHASKEISKGASRYATIEIQVLPASLGGNGNCDTCSNFTTSNPKQAVDTNPWL